MVQVIETEYRIKSNSREKSIFSFQHEFLGTGPQQVDMLSGQLDMSLKLR